MTGAALRRFWLRCRHMKALSAALLAAAGILVLSLGVAAPAHAAGPPIDPGDALYAINCDPELFNDWQLFAVEPQTGFSVPVGKGSGGKFTDSLTCGGPGAVNPATGVSYYVRWQSKCLVAMVGTDCPQPDPDFDSVLATIDSATGASSAIAEFSVAGSTAPEPPLVKAFAIGLDGAAYAFAETDPLGADWRLYSVDLKTAQLTQIAPGLPGLYAFAVNPVDGRFYAIEQVSNQLFRMQVKDGALDGGRELLGSVAFNALPHSVLALQIDESGRFWMEADYGTPIVATLWSVTLDTLPDPIFAGFFGDDDPYYTEGLLLIPGDPAVVLAMGGAPLPASGQDPFPVVLAGILLLLAGLVLNTVRLSLRPRRS
jgi:hypothetical protein